MPVLTRGLQTVRNEFNRVWPGRDKASDGWIAGGGHTVSNTGHVGDRTGDAEYKDGDALDEVRAIDVDRNLVPGSKIDWMELVIQYLVKRGRAGHYIPFRYIIYKGRIWRRSTGWKTETYTGANRHTEHAHFSGDYTQAADNWTGSLGLAAVKGDLMTTQAEFDTLMDNWWVKRMSPAAADNPQRAALRVAPWNQEVGRTGDSTHNVLFGTMRAQLATLAASGSDDDPVDEAAIVAGLLAVLTPEAIASAIPDDLAGQVADELAARLGS